MLNDYLVDDRGEIHMTNRKRPEVAFRESGVQRPLMVIRAKLGLPGIMTFSVAANAFLASSVSYHSYRKLIGLPHPFRFQITDHLCYIETSRTTLQSKE